MFYVQLEGIVNIYIFNAYRQMIRIDLIENSIYKIIDCSKQTLVIYNVSIKKSKKLDE